MRLSEIVRQAEVAEESGKTCAKCGAKLDEKDAASGACAKCRKALLGDDFKDPNGNQFLTNVMTRRPIAPFRVPFYY